MTYHRLLVLMAGGHVLCAGAQTPATPVRVGVPPVADSSVFAPIPLPLAPSGTRLATGAPGPRYWQNRADYDLHATLDTVTGTVRGMMTLRYTNNSPNILPVLWFQTEQNGFRDHPGASSSEHPYGDIIDQFTVVVDGKDTPVSLEDHATEAKVTLPTPLHPGNTVTVHATWHFVVPPRGQAGDGNNARISMYLARMGRTRSQYHIAQWYPRVNVYDDVHGWNIEPYLGEGEFFLEYGDFTLAVTVPASYIVAATGTLDNPRDVLTPTEIDRLTLASHADTVVPIVTVQELRNGAAHPKKGGMVTWRFHAQNVRDAVFAASPAYPWDATSWHGILAQAYYRPAAAPAWHNVADMARMSIQKYSERWYPYPYPRVSVAEGDVPGGMEYPMISFDGGFGVADTATDGFDLITHETGHNWFPMIVGSNERMHAWMDEGFNEFINTFSNARRYPQSGDQQTRANAYKDGIEQQIRENNACILDTPADDGCDAYNKPVAALQMVRQTVLGPAVFDSAFRTYIRRWAYKHPTPQDFFRTMNDVSGRNLDWFWREWFLETPGFDQAIDSVTQTMQGSTHQVTVVYGNHARGVLPLLVRFTFRDGTTRDVTYPADVWRANTNRYTATYTFPSAVTRIELDPEHHLIDTNPANNVWSAP